MAKAGGVGADPAGSILPSQVGLAALWTAPPRFLLGALRVLFVGGLGCFLRDFLLALWARRTAATRGAPWWQRLSVDARMPAESASGHVGPSV